MKKLIILLLFFLPNSNLFCFSLFIKSIKGLTKSSANDERSSPPNEFAPIIQFIEPPYLDESTSNEQKKINFLEDIKTKAASINSLLENEEEEDNTKRETINLYSKIISLLETKEEDNAQTETIYEELECLLLKTKIDINSFCEKIRNIAEDINTESIAIINEPIISLFHLTYIIDENKYTGDISTCESFNSFYYKYFLEENKELLGLCYNYNNYMRIFNFLNEIMQSEKSKPKFY